MQNVKSLTHGNSLKVAQFHGKTAGLAECKGDVYLDRLLPGLTEWEWEWEFPHPPPFPVSLDSPQPLGASNDFPQEGVALSTDGSVGPLLRAHVAGARKCKCFNERDVSGSKWFNRLNMNCCLLTRVLRCGSRRPSRRLLLGR